MQLGAELVVTPKRAPETPTDRPSDILESLVASEQPSIILQDVVATFGSRGHAVAILLLALPETIPLPIPSVGLVLGVAIMVIAGHLVLFGDKVRIANTLGARPVPMELARKAVRLTTPVLRRLESLSRPRLGAMANPRAVGAIAVAMAFLLALPLPFLNSAPAICLVVLAIGLLGRDGALVAVSAFAGVVIALAAYFSFDLFLALFHWVGSIF